MREFSGCHSYLGGHALTHIQIWDRSVNIRTHLLTSKAAEVISENSKINNIFGITPTWPLCEPTVCGSKLNQSHHLRMVCENPKSPPPTPTTTNKSAYIFVNSMSISPRVAGIGPIGIRVLAEK